MKKLRHRMFSNSITSTRINLILPHILHPCITVVQDSTDVLFPKNFDQRWYPRADLVYFKEDEIAFKSNAKFCQHVNTIFKNVSQSANAGQEANGSSLLVELIASCNKENKNLNEDMRRLAEAFHNGRDNDGGMGFIGAMIGLNDLMIPNDLAVITAQIYQTLINKDYQFFIELQAKLIESLSDYFEIYIAASDHYDEQFIAKLLFCLADILHYNNFLNNTILPESINRLISKIECTYPIDSRLYWSQFAFKFHYVFYNYNANLPKNAIDQLNELEGNLFSLAFNTDEYLLEKSKNLLQGSYVYNKCQLVDVGYSEKIRLFEYSKGLLSQALDNNDEIMHEFFSEIKRTLHV